MAPRLNDFAVGRQRDADRLARELINLILTGNLQPGDFIGSEDNLIERFGYSRPVVRECLRMLERDAIVTVRSGPGGGVFCSKPDTRPLARSLELYGVFHGLTPSALADGRVELEVATVRLAVRRGTEEELAEIARAAERWRHNCRANDNTSAAQANVDFHRLIAVAAHSPMLLIFMEVAESVLFTSAHWPRATLLGLHAESHDAILSALSDRDADAASRHMRDHLENFRYRAEEMEREGWFIPVIPDLVASDEPQEVLSHNH
jgi:GntR family transcriptional repressor for pyruvate dehydrogenase complex